MRFVAKRALAIVLAGFASGAAWAHHSFVAEFDPAKPKTIEGTVTELQWENPHTRFYMLVKNPGDPTKYDRWEVELGAPNTLVKYGWNRRTLGPGMAVTVAGFMARDGHNYMNSLSVKLPSGQTVLAGSSYRGSAEVVKPPGS